MVQAAAAGGHLEIAELLLDESDRSKIPSINHRPPKYDHCYILLLFEEYDTIGGASKEAEALKAEFEFETRWGFIVDLSPIPIIATPRKQQAVVEEIVSSFVSRRGGSFNLLLVYYGGHSVGYDDTRSYKIGDSDEYQSYEAHLKHIQNILERCQSMCESCSIPVILQKPSVTPAPPIYPVLRFYLRAVPMRLLQLLGLGRSCLGSLESFVIARRILLYQNSARRWNL